MAAEGSSIDLKFLSSPTQPLDPLLPIQKKFIFQMETNSLKSYVHVSSHSKKFQLSVFRNKI